MSTIPEVISTAGAPAAIGPYSQALAWENLIFTAGQIPLDPRSAEMVTGGPAEQTRRVLDNLRAVLEAAGSSLGHVLKATVFVTDLAHFAEINAVWGEYFIHHPPARSTVQVAALPRGALVEVDLVAVRNPAPGSNK
ncbi:MAG: RidA family protein [Armatimonadetes bacterium]|nr:RidA family protein [Armatimonadota bacterium]